MTVPRRPSHGLSGISCNRRASQGAFSCSAPIFLITPGRAVEVATSPWAGCGLPLPNPRPRRMSCARVGVEQAGGSAQECEAEEGGAGKRRDSGRRAGRQRDPRRAGRHRRLDRPPRAIGAGGRLAATSSTTTCT
jgi:hypothetical protein